MTLDTKLRRKAHVKKKREELGLRYKKNAPAVRKQLLAVPSQQIATLQPNTKTRLDIRYPTVGLHKTK
jgi:hypothetical protein